MTFEEQAALAADPIFITRVGQAAIKSALAVLADTPTNTPEAIDAHRKRAQLGREVLLDPMRLAASMARGVAANPVITADSIDSDIEFTVNSVWNAYAGVVLSPA
ncbi:MAG: hypothetical protein IPM06_19885 [Rhizobiales bacterium]|nr:hypothetical protein [Hyphomicrobiales bacterium]